MYTVYKITNTVNGKFYIGVHKTNNPLDSYMGSGLAIKQAISKYGRESFIKEILFEYETSHEAFDKERTLLEDLWATDLTYNKKPGGSGGWEAWNMSRSSDDNPMKRPEVVEKNLTSRMETLNANREKYIEIAKQNLQKAVESNTGKKRPDHSKTMAEKGIFREMWKDKEAMRDKLASHWEVTSPTGEVYSTNRLEDFCNEWGLTYVSVWETHRTGRPVKKGKSKGWICRRIDGLQ